MFAPRPPDTDFWYVFEANLTSGAITELWRDEGLFHWRGGTLRWDMPTPLHRSIGNHRWYKYFEVYNQADQAGAAIGVRTVYVANRISDTHHYGRSHVPDVVVACCIFVFVIAVVVMLVE